MAGTQPVSAEPSRTLTARPARRARRSRRSALREALLGLWAVLRANLLTLVGFLLVVIILVVALLIYLVPLVSGLLGHPASVLPYPPSQTVAGKYLGPSWAHPFGTDNAGQDVFSRVLAALPIDLSIGVSITLSALALGGALGLIAGFWDKPGTLGGAASVVILRITDIFLAFPSLVLALAIAASLGRTFVDALLAIAATWWPLCAATQSWSSWPLNGVMNPSSYRNMPRATAGTLKCGSSTGRSSRRAAEYSQERRAGTGRC